MGWSQGWSQAEPAQVVQGLGGIRISPRPGRQLQPVAAGGSRTAGVPRAQDGPSEPGSHQGQAWRLRAHLCVRGPGGFCGRWGPRQAEGARAAANSGLASPGPTLHFALGAEPARPLCSELGSTLLSCCPRLWPASRSPGRVSLPPGLGFFPGVLTRGPPPPLQIHIFMCPPLPRPETQLLSRPRSLTCSQRAPGLL